LGMESPLPWKCRWPTSDPVWWARDYLWCEWCGRRMRGRFTLVWRQGRLYPCPNATAMLASSEVL